MGYLLECYFGGSVSDNFLSFIDGIVKMEEAIVKSVETSVENMSNFAVRSALRGISYDSLKHAEMYRSVADILTEPRPVLDEKQLDEQRTLVAKHINMEEKIIAKLESIIPSLENDKASYVLNLIIEDERRHHAILKRVEELLVKGETVTEEDWWDAVFGDVPGLWT